LGVLHPIRRQCTSSDRVQRPVTGAVALALLFRAGLLCAPVGGGPPASRPRREPSARRVDSLSGQALPPPTGAAETVL